MYSLQTSLMHFRFNAVHNHGPYLITWYKLTEANTDSLGGCLSKDDLDKLTNYVINNKINFTNPISHACHEKELPVNELSDFLASDSGIPDYVIIRKHRQTKNHQGVITPVMEIELLNQSGTTNHTYDLEFDIIGEIIK